MLFHASKIVSALILLNTSVSLAMKNGNDLLRQNSGGHDTAVTHEFGVRDQSISCGDRIYKQKDITWAIIFGLDTMKKMRGKGVDIGVMQYFPKRTEIMPPEKPFYFSELNDPAPKQPRDLVIFTSRYKFVKVVTQHLDGRAEMFEDCVPLSDSQSSERYSPKMQSPERHSPKMQSPERYSPETQSPERYSPEILQFFERYSPKIQSPERYSPEIQSPERYSPKIQSPERNLPKTQSPDRPQRTMQSFKQPSRIVQFLKWPVDIPKRIAQMKGFLMDSSKRGSKRKFSELESFEQKGDNSS